MTALMEKIRQEHRSIAEEVSQLFKETQIFLSDVTVERHKQAKKQAEELFKFHQNLQQENRDFLTETEKQRIEQAKKQAEELFKFHQNLEQENREFLTVTHERRMTNAQEQNQKLRQFRRDLFISIFGIPSSSPPAKQPKTLSKQPTKAES
ncbi:gas vesicle protein GvpC [Phormidium sp. LEGE 05292]|uniref:gas vesicle protein GvpC n=1 Tax=[Phormidium] sp. LEGE 05292 TaxID=767427 RepID=UPI00187E16BE|nr:gas vesicle protein GvpC [Phormidium sp. LEGE 05292]MBE9228880.1 gas vesicle protein GvpC [Phormidium sp. LEGE 05292]